MQKILSVIIGLTIFLTSCGVVKPGQSAAPADAVPPGTLVAMGPFNGVNGKTVSGTAKIYLAESVYTLRIESFVAPAEAGMQIFVTTNGTIGTGTDVKSNTGNQNYPLTITGNPTWNSVTLKSSPSGNPASQEYGLAILTAQTGTN